MPFGWGRRDPSDVDMEQARELAEAGWRFLDVREPHEYTRGHVPGAVPAPMSQLARNLPAGGRWLVICESGNRSRVATRALAHAGLEARNVRGGMKSWRRASLPTETGTK